MPKKFASSKYASRSYKDRKSDTKEPRERFLIVCEGERTEPNYFQSFRVPKRIVDIHGVGFNTVSLVKEAIRIKLESSGAYDQTWCVFDRDSFPAIHFNEAIALADRNDILIAYSNEAFELWYLLHFNYYDTAISRKEYMIRLDKLLRRKYKKNDLNIYDSLLDKQPDALRHAKRLFEQYDPHNPEQDNPSTTVFKLVEALNRSVQ